MARNRSETPPTKFEVKSPPCRSSLMSGSVPPAANEYGSPPLPPDVATMSRSPSPNPPKNKSEEEEEEEEEESAPSRSGGLMLRTLPGWGKGILSCFHGKMRPPIDEAAFGRGSMGKGMLSCFHGKMRPPIDEAAFGRGPMGKGILSSFHGKMRPPIDEAAFGCRPMAEYIEKYYLAASERLPLEEIPDLVGCINAGGLCVGLADPVTNIILNAIALLQQQPSPLSQPPTTPPSQKTKKMYRWFPIATKSYGSLCAFMTAYFNYLSRTQAQRYLYLACQDLALAINLVHYDRFPSYSQEQQRCLLPDGGQIKAALRAAALQARHPAPDVLAGLMTAQYPAHLLSPILATLQNNNDMLTPINVWEIKDLLAHQWPRYPSPTNIGFRCRPDGITCTRRMNGGWLIEDRLDEGIVACISISRAEPSQHQLYLSQLTFQDEGIDARLSSCLVGPVIARLQEQHDEIEVDYDDHPCEHILSLRMCLLKTIHSFYIKALAKLPSTTRSARLFRALLVAGHCYGPMDPVSNIILSTTWYDIAFGADVGIPQGIFSTTPLSRMVSRSLDGLVAISSLTTCESEHEALYNINTLGCDLSTYLFDTANDESLSSTQETAVSNTVLFAAAAKAAKHPQHEAFVSFVKSLSAKKLIFLRHLLNKPSSRILSHDWDKLNSFLRSVMPFSTRNDMDAPLTLFSFASLEMFHPSASLVMAPSASQMMSRDKQAIVCTELNKMLDEYCYQHPWEPSYKLDVVCGVMQSSCCAYYGNSTLYHANFLASSDDGTCTSSQTEATLFFAEFWEPSLSKDVQLNPSSCRPIKNHLYTGRCSICEREVSMIIHPPCGGHSGDIKGSIDIYPGAAESVLTLSSADLLGSDMYYDPDTYFPPPIGNDSPVIASTPTAQPSTSMAQPSLRKKRQRGNGVEVVDAKPSFSSSKNFLKNSDYDTS